MSQSEDIEYQEPSSFNDEEAPEGAGQNSDIDEGAGQNSDIDEDDVSEWEEFSSDPDVEFSEDEEIESIDPSLFDTSNLHFGDVSPLEGLPCVCKSVEGKREALSLMLEMSEVTPNFDNIDCIVDNIIRCFNNIFSKDKKRKTGSKKIAFADLFYRARHEILFKLLCLTLNLPVMHSDEKFSNYGIDSERTPDLIIEDLGVIKIIEVTAVSSMEKASQNKGYDVMGFESKYKKEMDMFNDKGITCIYLPVFFDMSGHKNTVNKEQIHELGKHFPKVNESFKKLLNMASNQLAMLTNNMRASLTLPSSILFSEMLPITPKHDSLSFLYSRSREPVKENNYECLTVSPYVYNKIINDRNRFYWMLDNNNFNQDANLIFIINTINHRVSLELNKEGVSNEQLRQFLMDNDIIKILKYTKVKAGNNILDSTSSETGVQFYERTKMADKPTSKIVDIPLLVNHSCSGYNVFDFSMKKYKSIIKNYKSNNYHSIHYSESYEQTIIDSIIEFDRTRNENYDVDEFPNLLGCQNSRDVDIDQVMLEIEEKYKSKNEFSNETIPMRVNKMKQPFLLPIANLSESSYCKLDNKNINFINFIIRLIETKNPYTALVLKEVTESRYSMYNVSKAGSSTLNGMINERYEISNRMNMLQKKLNKEGSSDGVFRVSKTKDPRYESDYKELSIKYRSVNSAIGDRKKVEGIGANISYVKLPTKNRNSHLRKMYDFEMGHFKDRKTQSTTEGVGIINNIRSDYESDLQVFQELSSLLCEDRGENPDKVLDEYVSPDASLIHDLKKKSIDLFSNLITEVRRSYLGHASALISRMAHSLMFYSQLPFSSDYIRVDNLGYKNVLLIVRGGKKIFKSKSSKLFRMIFPISEEIIPWYNQGHRNIGSFTIMNINGDYYGFTPWSYLHESILTDSISFYSRVSSFTFLNLNPVMSLKSQFNKVVLNVLLSFHNRRQTEVMLANMRYILLSTLGDFTGVSQILPEFFDFNYDRFQAFIRNSLILNYPVYFKQLQELKDSRVGNGKEINVSDFLSLRLRNIFTLDVVGGVEDLALMIYSTFLMTKAPYQKIAERARNLRGILDIHDYFNKTIGLGLNPEKQTEKISVSNKGDLIDYTDRLFKNDFNFDPKFCGLVGNFINSYLINNGEKEDIESSWIRIMNQPWDEMATSTGLRGDYDELEDFWGQKGYFVVYKSLLGSPGFSDNLKKIFDCDVDADTKRKIVRGMNETFKEKFLPDREFLIFHAVDKVQWRGGREIYVMDLMTKTMQQPIEKFMAVLCKKLDNELISIPSDRRSQVIHHSIFEKDLPLKEMLTWYLTLDCSKWAPKSVFIKFVVMLLNMSCIPNTFKTHFMNYIEKLYSKRIYFNTSEVLALKKNLKYKKVVEDYLIEDTHVKGYYLEMPYSWVMGIFNYTSSFLHAANQKYFSYILMKTSLLSYKEETSIVMFAHSDDSGGRLSSSNIQLAKRAVVLYEIFLKSCNHLLSKKKSVISRIYFEILSVIYIFKKLLALLPKFLGGLRFLPTDKGPAQDMLQSYSKSIEVMVAGSDFSISYLVLKVYSYMVWRFYYHKDPHKNDYNRPVQYLGMPDSHPLFILLCGSDADILRLIRNGKDLSKLIIFINTMSKQMDGEGPIKPLKFEIKVKGIKRGFEDYLESFEDELGSWSIRNVNYHNTAMNTMSFLRKLNDSGFVGSLVNESTVRRISRCYYIRSGDSAITRFGNVKLSTLMDSINLCQSFTEGNSSITSLFNGVLEESAIKQIGIDFDENSEGAMRSIALLKETLKSPLRIYKYLDLLSLEGRKIIPTSRTLKPTQVQLVKSARVFSSRFDPATLVSYIKEPEMRWALPNIKGVVTGSLEVENFLKNLGYDFTDVDSDLLLRVCRTYGVENTKNIYLYSRVPGEVRQIKTYAAFLTFLSVNSFINKEIQGLTLKLDEKEMGREYVQPNIKEEVYMVNNVISLLLTLNERCGSEFIRDLKILCIDEIEWTGGVINDFIDHIGKLSDTDVRYSLVKAQISYLKMKIYSSCSSAEVLDCAAYYTFLKSQKSRGGWYGKGEVYIKIDANFYSFNLQNKEIVSMYTNKVGKIPEHHSEFILDVFNDIGVTTTSFKRPKNDRYNENYFGFDNSNEISILPGREISLGIPSISLVKRNDFVDHLDTYEIIKYMNNKITICKGFEDQKVFKTINLLPIKKAELIGTIKSIIDPKDFEDKILEFGVNDFEEFIYTEILTEYGKNMYVDFSDLFDNFAASRMYHIFREVHKKEMSKLPKQVEFSPLPASEGSLVRILIDYSRHSNENIISAPLNLDPSMMELRSEYPEQMATVLGEKLESYHKQIYSPVERKEITDNYDLISKEQDVNKKRVGLIKLMTYWGYGSLINNVKTFTLSRSIENFSFFNTDNLKTTGGSLYADIYEVCITKINDLMRRWRPNFNSLEVPINVIKKYQNNDSFIDDYMYFVVMSVYNLVSVGVRPSIYELQYFNMFCACLKEEDFVAELQDSFRSNYILSSLPISWELRFELIATINTLKTVWVNAYKTNYDLNYLLKLQRLPDNVPNYKSLLRKFDISLSGKQTYYSGFLSDSLLSYIFSIGEIEDQGKKFRLNNSVVNKSQVEVNVCSEVKHVRPILGDVLEDGGWEDYNYELTMGELDLDEIEYLRGELPENIYKDTTVRKLKIKNQNIISAQIKWIVCPNVGSTISPIPYFRQVGDNIIVMTDSFMGNFKDSFPNSGLRIVNYGKILKDNVRPLLLYYSFSKELSSPTFIQKFLGGQELNLTSNELDLVRCNWLRDFNGEICDPVDQGLKNSVDLITGESKLVDHDGFKEVVKGDIENNEEVEISKQTEEDLQLKKLNEIKLVIKNIEDENIINEDSIKNIKNKYMKKSIQHNLPISVILRSILEESDLLRLNENIMSNKMEISAEDQKKMFLSPSYFSLAQGLNRVSLNPIKDKKVSSELNSFHPDLAASIGSNTLKLSKKFSKVVLANIKFWVLMIKNSKVKSDNKKFLLNLFISICNNVILSEDEGDDMMWQEMVNKTSLYISSDDNDDDEDEFFNIVFDIVPASRIKYRSEGT